MIQSNPTTPLLDSDLTFVLSSKKEKENPFSLHFTPDIPAPPPSYPIKSHHFSLSLSLSSSYALPLLSSCCHTPLLNHGHLSPSPPRRHSLSPPIFSLCHHHATIRERNPVPSHGFHVTRPGLAGLQPGTLLLRPIMARYRVQNRYG